MLPILVIAKPHFAFDSRGKQYPGYPCYPRSITSFRRLLPGGKNQYGSILVIAADPCTDCIDVRLIVLLAEGRMLLEIIGPYSTAWANL